MKKTKKILAFLLLVAIAYGVCSGVTQLIWNDWRTGFITVSVVLVFYAALWLVWLFDWLVKYISKD